MVARLSHCCCRAVQLSSFEAMVTEALPTIDAEALLRAARALVRERTLAVPTLSLSHFCFVSVTSRATTLPCLRL